MPTLPDLDLHTLLATTAHRPYPLPQRPWRLRQRWNDLLFAHWAISPDVLASRLPAGLEPDTYDGKSWLGVIPFWMDQVRTRSIGEHTFSVPTTDTFPELNLRTYVRSTVSGLRGVFFYSLDCASPLAVFGARTLFHLPYFPAVMSRIAVPSPNPVPHASQPHRDAWDQPTHLQYRSHRILTRRSANYEATYGPTGPQLAPSQPGSLAHFLTERYCLFTPFAGRMLVGQIHHQPWPLQPAEADIRLNEIPAAHGFILPDEPPVLHFSRTLQVVLWSLTPDRQLTL